MANTHEGSLTRGPATAGAVAEPPHAGEPLTERASADAPAEGYNAAAAAQWLERGRIPCLDGLRALSIALVFIEHIAISAGTRGRTLAEKSVGNIGVLGVDVFFAISGFLITLLLLRERRNTGKVSLAGFYGRRFLRLMPAAIVYLATVAALQWSGRLHLTTRNWVHAVTYTVNFDPRPVWELGHLWSLSIEEHFYLVWPVALLLLPTRWLLGAVVGWLVAVPAARLAMLVFVPDQLERVELWTLFRVDSIAAGCLLALLSQHEWFRRRTRLGGGVSALLMVGLAAVMLGGYVIGFVVTSYFVLLDATVRAVCISALIWLTINQAGSPWFRLLESRPLVVVGVLSYSLYLWQQLFITHPSAGAAGLMNRLPYSVVLAVAAAVASHLLVERPFLSLKARLNRHR